MILFLLTAFISSLCMLIIHVAIKDNFNFSGTITKPFFDCYPCMCSVWGTLLFFWFSPVLFSVWYKDLPTFILTCGGINVVISLLILRHAE